VKTTRCLAYGGLLGRIFRPPQLDKQLVLSHDRKDQEIVRAAMSFYSELKRRNVIRVAAGYVVSAWLLIQVAETIFPLFGFDDGPARVVVMVLAIGFLPTVAISWIFELTPDGFKKDRDADRSLASAATAAKRFDRAVMLILVLAVSYFAFDKFVLSESREQAIVERTREELLAEAQSLLESNKSIAVLPFADMSPNKDQEYFADGITEELLDELAQLQELNVTGRTSSFKFKGHNEDLRIIGEQLGVTYILEGSVRKDGDKLRITTQLIDSQTGTHLWSDSYDRPTDEIFDVQDEIARTVAGALSIKLDVEGRNHLPGTGTNNVEAYDVFLQALAARGFEFTKALYERAIELDPDYAEAYVGLGAAYGVMLSWQLPPIQAREAQNKGRELVVRATELDPNLAMAYSMLSGYQWAGGDWIGATEYHSIYSALAPADIPARLGSANILSKTGRLRDAVQISELDRQTDPLNFFTATIRAEIYIQAGRYDDAEAELARIVSMTSGGEQSVELRRMLMAFSKGDHERIRNTLQNYSKADSRVSDIVSAVMEKFDSPITEVLAVLNQLYNEETEITGEGKLIVASLAAHFGDQELALDIMAEELRGNLVRVSRIWYPFFSEMRQLPGFKSFVEDIGFVAYWRKYGWADTCHPIGDDDFECD